MMRTKESEISLHQSAETEPSAYSILDTEVLREQYITLTDRLMAHIDETRPDRIVLLDKSARPVYWLMKELWPLVHNDDEKMPEISFLNIDREQWGAIVGRSEDKDGFDWKAMPQQRLDELRAMFTLEATTAEEAAKPETKSLIDDKNVLVVDEVKSSGDTLEMASKFIEAAGKNTRVEGVHWMQGMPVFNQRLGGTAITQLPIWYDSRNSLGRGVGDRDSFSSRSSPSLRQKTGRYWLSSRLPEVDEKSNQLRKECHQIAQDVTAGKLAYRPSSLRGADDFIDIATFLNHVDLETYQRLTQAMSKSSTPVSFSELIREYRAFSSEAN